MLASGKPVLATANPGTELHDMLQGAAMVIEPGDAMALTDAILAAADGQCLEMSAKAAGLIGLFGRGENLQRFARTISGENQDVT
jgi:colanic acid biosynthesis glycosyl transferase WcaI